MAKDPQDWLPITGSRGGNWWYSSFHNVTAMVGAGVLGLPSAMIYLGWGPGVLALVLLSWIITLYTLWQMIQMHEMIPGKRLDRYHKLGQAALGDKWGLIVVVPQQIIVEVGVDIVYMVTGGQSLKKFYSIIKCPDTGIDPTIQCGDIKATYWILIFGSVHTLLSQLPNFNTISGISLAAAVMSIGYSTISWVDTSIVGQQRNDYGYPDETSATLAFGAMNSLGTIAFAYAGHNVVLEIQATLPSTPEKPSKIEMWQGVLVAYAVVAICYFTVALCGYWAFGNTITGNILLALGKPRWLIATANMMVVVHVIGSYQVYAMPVFDMLEILLMRWFTPSCFLCIISRSLYVVFTAFIGCTFPANGHLLGFLGDFAFAPTTYFLPCIFWLRVYKPKPFQRSWIANWVCIWIGIILAIVSSVGGLQNIIVDASKYKFYS